MCLHENCIIPLYEGILDIFKALSGKGHMIIQICSYFLIKLYLMSLTSNKLWIHQMAAIRFDNFVL